MTTRVSISKQVSTEQNPMTLLDIKNFLKDAEAAGFPLDTAIHYNCPSSRPLWKPLVGLRARSQSDEET